MEQPLNSTYIFKVLHTEYTMQCLFPQRDALSFSTVWENAKSSATLRERLSSHAKNGLCSPHMEGAPFVTQIIMARIPLALLGVG